MQKNNRRCRVYTFLLFYVVCVFERFSNTFFFHNGIVRKYNKIMWYDRTEYMFGLTHNAIVQAIFKDTSESKQKRKQYISTATRTMAGLKHSLKYVCNFCDSIIIKHPHDKRERGREIEKKWECAVVWNVYVHISHVY